MLSEQEEVPALPCNEDLDDAPGRPLAAHRPLALGLAASLALHLSAISLLVLFFRVDSPGARQDLPILNITLSSAGLATPRSASRPEGTRIEPIAPQVVRIRLRSSPPVAIKRVSDSAKAPDRGDAFDLKPYLDTTPGLTTSAGVGRDSVIVTNIAARRDMPHASTASPEAISTPAHSLSKRLTADQLTAVKERIVRWRWGMLAQLKRRRNVTWRAHGQRYTARFRQVPAQSASDFDRVEITVSTRANGKNLKTQIWMTRIPFSHYGQFVNRWSRNLYLHQDVIGGAFHVNSSINIDVSDHVRPVFRGEVTVGHRVNIEGFAIRARIFPHGVETGAKYIALPVDVSPLSDNQSVGAKPVDVQHIHGDASVVFLSDGSFTWHSRNDSASHRHVLPQRAFYIVGDRGSRLSVKGLVKGRVVVYSPEEISISGDLRYVDDPEGDSPSTDFLGLVSEKYVDIAPPDVTGPGDLNVYAAIYAKRRFSVRDFTRRNKGTLTIYGSLVAGSISASEPRYATTLHFDKRFKQRRPPGFPMTNLFALEQWDRQWQVDR